MSSPISPIVSGLVNAFSLANMVKRQQQADEQLAMAKAREERIARQEQEQTEYRQADLQMRLSAMGARAATESDDLEAQTGQRIDFGPRGIPLVSPSDIKGRLVKAGGQRYVLPSLEEREGMADRASERETKRKTREAEAVAKARTQADIAGTKAKLETLGYPIEDKIADELGIPRGRAVMPEQLPSLAHTLATMRAARIRNEKNVAHTLAFQDQNHTGVAVVMNDGTVKWNEIEGLGGKPHAPQRPASATEQRLSDNDARKKLIDEAAGQYFAAENDVEKAIARLKADANSNHPTAAFLKKNLIAITRSIRSAAPKASAAANDPAAIIQQLDQVLNKPAAPAAAPVVEPKKDTPALRAIEAAQKPKKTATGDNIRAYAKRKGISYAAAEKEFRDNGYEIR